MPIETANFISQLDPTNPAAPDLLADPDNHLRMIKQVLKNSFPNMTGPTSATHLQLNGFVPIGGMIMWSGSVAPSGWAICNGQTVARSDGAGNIVTPDLTDVFILGPNAGLTNIGTRGGSTTISGTTGGGGAHGHSGNTDVQGAHAHYGATGAHALSVAEMPSHAHYYEGGVVQANYGAGPAASCSAPFGRETGYMGGNQAHIHAIGADGAHAHNLNVSSVGDHTHALSIGGVRPPFYVLAFIMKV